MSEEQEPKEGQPLKAARFTVCLPFADWVNATALARRLRREHYWVEVWEGDRLVSRREWGAD
jgi:hypothetical protein